MTINYAAVVVSAVIYWILGAVWYGVLFGTHWLALVGRTPEQVQAQGAAPYAVAFVANLAIAWVLALLCLHLKADTGPRGAGVGALAWLGFVATTAITEYAFEGRPMALFAINAAYPLVGMLMVGALLGAWTKKRPEAKL